MDYSLRWVFFRHSFTSTSMGQHSLHKITQWLRRYGWISGRQMCDFRKPNTWNFYFNSRKKKKKNHGFWKMKTVTKAKPAKPWKRVNRPSFNSLFLHTLSMHDLDSARTSTTVVKSHTWTENPCRSGFPHSERLEKHVRMRSQRPLVHRILYNGTARTLVGWVTLYCMSSTRVHVLSIDSFDVPYE